jgi:hypothetical protein
MDNINSKTAYTLNDKAFGNVRIWQMTENGVGDLLADMPNNITNQGPTIVTAALAGTSAAPNSIINCMYVQYGTGASVIGTGVGQMCSSFNSGTGVAGYAKIPLAFTPSFGTSGTGYASNLIYFTTYVTGTTAPSSGSSTVPSGQNITGLGLVSSPYPTQPANNASDLLFSILSPGGTGITYSSTYGVAITWGLTFLSA